MTDDGDYCWNCRTSKEKFRCGGCGFALYCSQICQREHWKSLHISHCKYLAGKKSLGPGHSPANCFSCEKESVNKNYKNLGKKGAPVMRCHIRMLKSNLDIFRKAFLNECTSFKKTNKERSNWNVANFPFQFGEISGDYLNYLDKLLGYLQSILCHLMVRYPKIEKLSKLFLDLLDWRAYHWAVSLQTGDTSERVRLTCQFISVMYSSSDILGIHETVQKLDSQNRGVSAWNTFLFLYEMLGVSSTILPMLKVDKKSVEKDDEKGIEALISQSSSFKTRIENLEIYDESFNLKSFHQISKHFYMTDRFFCDLCSSDVQPTESSYIFQSMGPFKNRKTWDAAKGKIASQIKKETAYISFNTAFDFRAICNTGSCQDEFENVALNRLQNFHLFTALRLKYEEKLGDLQCWVCKQFSGRSHRCSNCKSRLYCSQECLNSDWKVHKLICKELQESGSQKKIDSLERKELGEAANKKFYDSRFDSCNCGRDDCMMVANMNRIFGKSKEEVD